MNTLGNLARNHHKMGNRRFKRFEKQAPGGIGFSILAPGNVTGCGAGVHEGFTELAAISWKSRRVLFTHVRITLTWSLGSKNRQEEGINFVWYPENQDCFYSFLLRYFAQ